MISYNVFTLDDEQKTFFEDAVVPVLVKKITSTYTTTTTTWTIDFEVLHFQVCEYYPRIEKRWEKAQITFEGEMTQDEALSLAFSPKYWLDCSPMINIANKNRFFKIDNNFRILGKNGWRLQSVEFYDVFLLPPKESIINDIKSFSEKSSIKPSSNDIEELLHLIEFYIRLNDFEYTDSIESYDELCSEISEHYIHK